LDDLPSLRPSTISSLLFENIEDFSNFFSNFEINTMGLPEQLQTMVAVW
jgi:hypothetical protein